MDHSTVKLSCQHPSRIQRGFVGTPVLLSLLFAGTALLSSSLHAEETFAPTNPVDFKNEIQPFLEQHCVECHGEKKKKAKFFLHDIDGVVTDGKDIVRWEKILEMVSLQDMPPEDEDQPSKIERSRVLGWITTELSKIGRGQDEGKLRLPHQANRLNHEELFSGEHQGPASSPSRLWRKSPYIYDRFAREMRTQISQPLLGLGGKGIQDYTSLYADESTIKTMLRNSNLIAKNLVSAERTQNNRILNPLFQEGAEITEEGVQKAVDSLFEMIFQRLPTEDDRARYIDGLFSKNRELAGLKRGMHTLIVSMLMSQEFVYRLEVGLGEERSDGRRMLSPTETAYALSFAFHDTPEKALLKAATEGKLATKEDVVREVRRILDVKDTKEYWHYPMSHRWGEDYYQRQPRVLRFFQEFFGYTAVEDVFKDKKRNGTHHANRLRKDADMLVLSILEKDQNVLAELLTTNKYPMDYSKQDRLKHLLEGSNKTSLAFYKAKYEDQFDAIVKEGKWPGLQTSHVSAYNLDPAKADAIRRGPGEFVTFPKNQRAGMLTHPAWLVAHSGNFDNDPIRRGKWIREHLLADMVPDVPIGVDAKIPEDPHRTLRERLDVIRPDECWRCHKQMNPLGEPFEAYDDFGRYRDQIVLGDADAYFNAKRKYDETKERNTQELKKWLRCDAKGRAEKVAHAKQTLAALNPPAKDVKNYTAAMTNYEKSIKRWTKEIESWSTMKDEEQQGRVADLERRLASLTAPVAKTKPVDSSGMLTGTGNPALDGPVKDAVDLTHRLAKSERARQSFIRHAFRYWMGRNETFADSPTLIAADKAYVEHGGSFKEMLVSLLSSDSFLYRK